jgi:two-component system, OmpR family, response regulator ResD
MVDKILIVDDEQKIRTMIRKYAEFEGYAVAEAADGMAAVRLCREQHFAAIVMDVMMPELDGFSACREIFKHQRVPVLMLSARGEEYDKIHGFELGIDDYVVKPFSPKELMLRLNVLITRNRKNNSQPVVQERDMVRYGGLTVDFTGRMVYINDQKIELSPKEYDLLFFLVRNRSIALTRERLLSEVWGYDFFGDDRTLDTHVKLLRNSLGEYRKYIVTLRGVGYRFETE